MKNSVLSVAIALLVLVLFSGCQLGKSNQTTTDWSLPSVKLPTAKKEDIKNPAERADPKATSELAHQRVGGSNPTAAVGKDDALAPSAKEVANLNRFDDQNIPAWAQDGASADSLAASDSSHAVPVEAGDLRLPDLNADKTTGTNPTATAMASGSALTDSTSSMSLTPDSSELSSSLPPMPSVSQEMAASDSALPPLDSSLPPLDATLPQTTSSTPLAPIEAAPMPQTGNQLAVSQTSPVTPAALAVPATSANPAVQANPAAQTPATAPAMTSTSAASTTPATAATDPNANTQPAALFMPGNINPAYPNK